MINVSFVKYDLGPDEHAQNTVQHTDAHSHWGLSVPTTVTDRLAVQLTHTVGCTAVMAAFPVSSFGCGSHQGHDELP